MELDKLDLPPDAKAVLARGLPAEVKLSEFMPTVFSSVLGERPIRETPPGAAIDGYVIGVIHEEPGSRTELATFVLEQGTGRVFVVDVGMPESATFVNSDVARFLACIEALVQISDEAQRVQDVEPHAGERLSGALRARVGIVDPAAVRNDGYWLAWMDDLRGM